MWVCLKWKLKALAVSLSPRQMIELFRRIQLVEVWFDTADDRRICLPRITMPEPEHQVILEQIKWTCPSSRLPVSTPAGKVRPEMCWRLDDETTEFSKDLASRIPYLRNSG